MADNRTVDKKELEEMLDTVRKHFTKRPDNFAGEALKHILQYISNTGGCDKNNILKTALQVLLMLLEDPKNHDVQNLLNAVLSDPTVWGAIPGMPGTNQKTVKIPMNLNELRCCIRGAATRRQKIKAVSTNYSGLWNDIGDSKGIIINTSRLTASLELECLKKGKLEKDYCNFEAGITMDAIQEVLWPSQFRKTKDPKLYRLLENVTSGASLSLAGTASTGAHGNGLHNGNVADAVVSFQMFTIDSEWKVKRYQIEPSNGITDMKEFKAKHQYDDDNFQLIQNDEKFHASVVNIGCLGVVYSYVLSTVEGFCLEEERKIYKWKVAKEKIKELYNSKDKDLYNFQVIGSPYAYKLSPNETEDNRVLISVLRYTKVKTVGERPGGPTLLPIGLIDKVLVAAGDSTPHVVPILMHFPLMYLEHEKVVLNAVDALNTLAGLVSDKFDDVRTSECAMRSEGADTVIDIIESLHTLYDDIRKSNNRQLVNVPIALRFTSKSKHNMAMGYDKERPTITIEQSIINGTLGANDTLRQFREQMLKRFNGRPHWGMLHDMDAKKLKELYCEAGRKEFNSALKFFDPKFVFENEFADWVFGEERRNPNNE